MKFRKKPVVIEAIQWTGDNLEEVKAFLGEAFICEWMFDSTIGIKTLEGSLIGSLWDWVIRGVKGEKYPCKPDIFEATYEFVAEVRWPKRAGTGGVSEDIEHYRDMGIRAAGGKL